MHQGNELLLLFLIFSFKRAFLFLGKQHSSKSIFIKYTRSIVWGYTLEVAISFECVSWGMKETLLEVYKENNFICLPDIKLVIKGTLAIFYISWCSLSCINSIVVNWLGRLVEFNFHGPYKFSQNLLIDTLCFNGFEKLTQNIRGPHKMKCLTIIPLVVRQK